MLAAPAAAKDAWLGVSLQDLDEEMRELARWTQDSGAELLNPTR